MNIQINYEPNAKQALFHGCGSDEVFYGGAKGGGKSCALVMEAVAYGFEHPGAMVYLFRETYDELEANLIFEFIQKIPKEVYTYNKTDHIAFLKTDPVTRIHFRYVTCEEDAEGYNGRPMDWIGIDELTFHSKRTVQILMSCMRSVKGFKTYFRATGNPGGIGHIWVQERYINGTDHGERSYIDPETESTISFIPAKVYDNTVLMKNDPKYVLRLKNLPELRRKALLDGNWDVFEGQYFAEFDRDLHVIKPIEIKSWWGRFLSLDYGQDMTACLWWAVDGYGRCYIYREIAIPGLNLVQAAEKILENNRVDLDDENSPQIQNEYCVASPDLWNAQQLTGETGFEVMTNAGLQGIIKANNSRIMGWRIVRKYLMPFEDEFGQTNANLKIFYWCRDLIQNLPLLEFSKTKPEDVEDKKAHERTHTPDALRYGIMSRPQSGEIPEEPPTGIFARYIQKPRNQEITEEISEDYINYGA